MESAPLLLQYFHICHRCWALARMCVHTMGCMTNIKLTSRRTLAQHMGNNHLDLISIVTRNVDILTQKNWCSNPELDFQENSSSNMLVCATGRMANVTITSRRILAQHVGIHAPQWLALQWVQLHSRRDEVVFTFLRSKVCISPACCTWARVNDTQACFASKM